MANLRHRFIPKMGSEENLREVPIEEGIFIVTNDTRKIFTDAKIDNEVQRIQIGGVATPAWSSILNKPFETVSASDFSIITDVENDISELQVSDNLKFSNRAVLQKLSQDANGLLQYNDNPIVASGVFTYAGTVNSIAALQEISNPADGAVYLVNDTANNIRSFFVFLIPKVEEGETQQPGSWYPLFDSSALLNVDYNNLLNQPSINGTVLVGNKTLQELGIEIGYVIRGSRTFSELPTTLTTSMKGYVYNVTNDFTTTLDFLEGVGKLYSAGTNVVIVNAGTDENPSMKFDVLGNFIDTSAINASITAVSNIANAATPLVNIAATFDSTETYDENDLILYNKTLYKCTTAHTGEWDSDDFSVITVAEAISTLGGGTIAENVIDTPTAADINTIINDIWN